jgi:outer membrane immunogenic protein
MPSKRRIAMMAIGTQRLSGRMTWIAALLLGVTAASGQAIAQQQQQAPAKFHFGAPTVAVTYDFERAKVTNVSCGCFWLNGGSVDMAVPFYRGLSVAGSIGGDHATSNPGGGLSKISYTAGPRYTLGAPHTRIFGEALFGGTHGFDGTFPAVGAVPSSANSYAMQIGGGVDLLIHGGFGMRAFEVDYVRTALPNNGSNSQNDLRIAFGLTYHFGTN